MVAGHGDVFEGAAVVALALCDGAGEEVDFVRTPLLAFEVAAGFVAEQMDDGNASDCREAFGNVDEDSSCHRNFVVVAFVDPCPDDGELTVAGLRANECPYLKCSSCQARQLFDSEPDSLACRDAS